MMIKTCTHIKMKDKGYRRCILRDKKSQGLPHEKAMRGAPDNDQNKY